MSEPVAYLYDGTPEGLLCAIFQAYARHERPEDILRAECAQLRLGQRVREVRTSLDEALRVRRGIVRACGKRVFDAVLAACLADAEETGNVVYRFVRYALAQAAQDGRAGCAGCPNRSGCTTPCGHVTAARSRTVLSDIAAPEVAPFYRLNRAVFNERHRLLQFARFSEMEGGVWFARCNPAHAVVPLAMDHFANRFNASSFVLYDEVHRMAGVYQAPAEAGAAGALSGGGRPLLGAESGLGREGGPLDAACAADRADPPSPPSDGAKGPFGPGAAGVLDQDALETDSFWASAGTASCRLAGGWHIVRTDRIAVPPPAAGEREMRHAWRAFYRAAAVEVRYHPELRQGFLPQRFWRNVTEMQPELPDRHDSGLQA